MAKNYKSATKESLMKPKTHRLELSDGSVVFIRSLTAAYAIAIRSKDMNKDENIYDMIATSLCDESGKPISGEDGNPLVAADVAQIDVATMTEIVAGITKFNKLTPEALEKAQADLKNSPTEGSTTSSPKS